MQVLISLTGLNEPWDHGRTLNTYSVTLHYMEHVVNRCDETEKRSAL